MYKVFAPNVIYLFFRHKICFITYCLYKLFFHQFVFTDFSTIHNLSRCIINKAKLHFFTLISTQFIFKMPQ